MTWGELKAIALQKMYALSGPAVAPTREAAPYLEQLYAPANEALLLVATTARPLYRVAELVQDGPQGADSHRRYLLSEQVERFFKLADNLVYELRGGSPRKTADYLIELPGTLLLPNRAGCWRAVCHCYPQQLAPDTPDTAPLEVDPDAAVLLPLYIASQLFKDDEAAVAAQLRNEFELGLQRLAATAPQAHGGVEFVSVRGWR